MKADRHAFASLPEIDAVDVLVIDERVREKARAGIPTMHAYIIAAADAPCVRVTGAPAQRIAALWRRLRPDEQARCHIPPFGLRFHAGDVLVLQVSVCWECNNVFGYLGPQGSREIHLSFDAASSNARELLSLLQQLTREAPAGRDGR